MHIFIVFVFQMCFVFLINVPFCLGLNCARNLCVCYRGKISVLKQKEKKSILIEEIHHKDLV